VVRGDAVPTAQMRAALLGTNVHLSSALKSDLNPRIAGTTAALRGFEGAFATREKRKCRFSFKRYFWASDSPVASRASFWVAYIR
jgi:hypothetical protein